MTTPDGIELSPASLRCSLCGADVVAGEARACGLCATPHHPDCWEYTGMCSAYGCGGIADVEWKPGLVPVSVEIDGRRGHHALMLRTGWSSLSRTLRERSRDLPATLLAGGLGAGVATAALIGGWVLLRGPHLLEVTRFWTRYIGPYAGVLFGCGLGYGFLSPFLAPYTHRRPGLFASASGILALLIYLSAPRVTWPVIMMSGLLGILSAATVGEWMLGPYRPVGRKLGRLATPLRYLFVGLFFFVCGLGAAVQRGFHPSTFLIGEAAMWGLLAALGGGHALEVGKEEYRKHLVALVEEESAPEESVAT